MAKTNNVEYDFVAVSPSDYELTFIMVANQKLFNKIFNKSKAALAKKGVSIESVALIEKFDIPERYHNIIKTAIQKQIKSVRIEVSKDKIILLNSYVGNAQFKRNASEDWNISIKVVGQYADKR